MWVGVRVGGCERGMNLLYQRKRGREGREEGGKEEREGGREVPALSLSQRRHSPA